ncbi:class I SAM-dependent methyltransferase [Pantoea piersonii]|uniref:Class I SAM-dependent methyltransferase n=1 Tax=Pantoea piersonii TaxID=2364647 RepID=A0AAJ5QI09_9GAMM|nr:class I SAM-dependent methyltransferase [Pantoea piersonii]WBG90526.1 class I SAM-dependent methyltransferase [Pantoea piersonii]
MSTQHYYQHNAQQFFESTVAVDMAEIRDRFTALLPAHGSVLDAGCGSGRDAKAFAEQGFQVEAFDASPELAELASQHSGLPVKVMRFQELDVSAHYDGIWCCASLLHVPRAELPEVFRRLAKALKAGGVLYASFKYGQGEREDNGRVFTDMRVGEIAEILRGSEGSGLRVVQEWMSEDRRPERRDSWVNVITGKAK